MSTTGPIDWQAIAEHRGRRNARLEREVRFLEAERVRYERLLATALQIAAGPDCDPLVMLEVVAAITGDDPLSRPAFVADEERERAASAAPTEAHVAA